MSSDRTPAAQRPFAAAEAVFKKPSAPLAKPVSKSPATPNAKEAVTLRIDQEILEYFQEGGPGWQERINAALRRFVEGERQAAG